MHLKQRGFTYSACGPFTKNKERIPKFEETGDTSYVYKDELDKACFQLDMAYGDFKDLKRRTASDKILRDKAFNIAKNPKCGGCGRGLASVVYKLFDKKSASLPNKSVSGSDVANNGIKKKLQLAERNYTNQLLGNLKKEKFILNLKIIIGELI